MNYTRVNWKDYPETDTPLSAKNLNVMDEAIAELSSKVNEHTDILGKLFLYDTSTSTLTINLDALS